MGSKTKKGDLEVKIRFIELRAAGHSYADIAAELGICKNTAISWSKELKLSISNMRAIALDALQKRYELHQEARLEFLGQMLERLKSEFKSRDLSVFPLDKLLDKILKTSNIVARESPTLVFKEDVYDRVLDLNSLMLRTEEWSA